jgi:nucleotide-binding universal stress UspA family protein
MSYKTLLIHVEPTIAGRERLRAAVGLARQFDARLIGVGARAMNPMPDPIGISIVKLKEETETELKHAAVLFDEEARSLGAAAQWRAETDFPTQVLLRLAGGADLIVAGRWIEGSPMEHRPATADLIMSAGIPVLAVPAGATIDFRKIVIAWKDTREARRAVSESLPFLKRAEDVRVMRFDGEESPRETTDIAERLAMHGVHVKAEVRKSTESSVANDLLMAADEMGAGLIVAGGYGHSRLRQWVLGGVTHGLLQTSTKCVLFSH